MIFSVVELCVLLVLLLLSLLLLLLSLLLLSLLLLSLLLLSLLLSLLLLLSPELLESALPLVPLLELDPDAVSLTDCVTAANRETVSTASLLPSSEVIVVINTVLNLDTSMDPPSSISAYESTICTATTCMSWATSTSEVSVLLRLLSIAVRTCTIISAASSFLEELVT